MEEYKLDLPNETTFSGLSIFPDQRRIFVVLASGDFRHSESD